MTITSDSPKAVRLTYMNRKPTFMSESRFGNHLLFSFGIEEYGGDVLSSVVRFLYVLKKTGDVYEVVECDYAKLGKYARPTGEKARFVGQKPKIDELIAKVNVALAHNQEFDFSEYQNFWEQFDKYFELCPFERDDDSPEMKQIIAFLNRGLVPH